MKLLKLALPFLVALLVFWYAVLATPVMAIQGTIYFSPSSGRFDPGSTFTVDVRTDVQNPGTFAGGATVGVTYPNTLLKANAVTTTGGAMGGNASIDQSAGTVSFSSFTIPPKYGSSLLLFRITFQAMANGTANLGFSANTSVNDGPTTKQSATLTLQPATCPSGQVGTPPNCSTPPPAIIPTPTPAAPAPRPPVAQPTPPTPTQSPAVPDTSVPATQEPTPQPTTQDPLTIDDVNVTTSYDTARATWKPSRSGQSSFTYGTDVSNLDASAEVSSGEDGTAISEVAGLQPGVLYFYRISETAQGVSEPVTSDGEFTTKGYPVTLLVMRDSQPLGSANLELKGYKQTYSTDSKGKVNLSLKPGNYTVTIKKDGFNTEQKFEVKAVRFAATKAPDTQNITVTILNSQIISQSTSPYVLVGAGLLALGLIGAGTFFALWRKRHSAISSVTGYQSLIEDDYSRPATPTTLTQAALQPEYQQAPSQDEMLSQVAQVQTPYPMMYENQQYSSPVQTSSTSVTMNDPVFQEDEPIDMWSQSSQFVAPSNGTSSTEPAAQSSSDAPQPMILETQQPAEPITETTRAADGLPSKLTYEFEEDNSLTIHHSS